MLATSRKNIKKTRPKSVMNIEFGLFISFIALLDIRPDHLVPDLITLNQNDRYNV